MPEYCPDCGVHPGDLHIEGCDVERCMNCGGQRISCFCEDNEYTKSREQWTGEWPGYDACRELDLFCCHTSAGWKACSHDHPDARPDLNRLVTECDWDRIARKWVRRLPAS